MIAIAVNQKGAEIRRSRSSFLRAVATALVPLALAGCGCSTWGCVQQIRVTLSGTPPRPYRAALLVNGVPTSEAEEVCDGTRTCPAVISFGTSARVNVAVRVTTESGSRTTTFPAVTYRGVKEDGCHTCQYADVTAQIP